MDMLSVVVVTRNRPGPFERCLRSLVAQTLRPLEVVVIDNGSSVDYVSQTAPALAGIFSETGIELLVVRNDVNTGVSAARNQGARAASGRVVAWIDDDAWFDDRAALGKVMEAFAEPSSPVMVAYRVRELCGGSETVLVPYRRGAAPPGRPVPTSFFLGSACAVDRAFFLDRGGFDPQMRYQLEELEYSLRIAVFRPRILLVPEVEVIHQPADPPVMRHRAFVRNQAKSRLPIALRYLPWVIALVHVSVWYSYLAVRAIRVGAIREYMYGVAEALSRVAAELRMRRSCRLSTAAVRWLATLPNRLWY
jgi:glycosyltransferase involved in cell wall biosynthesis